MHSNDQFTNAVKSDPFKTLTKEYKPGNITKTHLSNFTLSAKSNDSLDVVVSWEAADDRTCHYSIYSYAVTDESNKITTEIINKVINGIWKTPKTSTIGVLRCCCGFNKKPAFMIQFLQGYRTNHKLM